MLPIDHHIQNALYKFNREMKDLNQEATVPSLAGHQRTVPMSSFWKWLTATETFGGNKKC